MRVTKLVIVCLSFLPCLLAQQPSSPPSTAGADGEVDQEAVEFFLEEGMQRSQVMEHLSWLCDVYGPRVTGSPNLRKAQAWVAKQFEANGMSAGREEWGPFGRGWQCEHVSMSVVGENPWPVIAYAKAWSPGIEACEAEVVHVAAMTAEELRKADVDGKVVLIDDVRAVREPFDGISKRHDATSLLRLANQQREETQSAADRAAQATRRNDFRIGFQKRQQMMNILAKKKPLLVVDRGSKGQYGTVFVTGARATNAPDTPRAERLRARDAGAMVTPQMTIAVEHYNRMCRVLAKGIKLRVAIDLRATFFADDLGDFNVIGELRGGELGDELSLMGAHLDSWQSGTGATDNGCGSAVVIEAARLISAWCKHKGIQPRRTIRACLWSGEEQGLLGSRAYVRKHFGTAEQTLPARDQVAGYFNLDNGTGRIRGVYLQGNETCAPIFRRWLRPFHVHAASTLTLDDTGGTDHLAFHRIGLPGFQFIQDDVSYFTATHHSNMDNWDHAVAEDLQQAAVIMATFVWQTAQHDDKLPRMVKAR